MTVKSQSGPTEDLISTATSALRRLHFKSGRVSSGKTTAPGADVDPTTFRSGSPPYGSPVPKVVVMGTSVTSTDTNINTSTDSSTTIITTVTTTDGEEIDEPIYDDQKEYGIGLPQDVDAIMNRENVFASGYDQQQPLTPTTAVERSPSASRHKHMFTYEEGHVACYRQSSTQLPDLRIDFIQGANEAAAPVCLNKCLLDVGAMFDAAASINVTPNPMAVTDQHHQQQPSRKASTIPPTAQHHLLDVTQAHCHPWAEPTDGREAMLAGIGTRHDSPHHSRSQSVKTPGRAGGGRPNYLCLPQQRSRVASMPNTGVEEEYYRLRHFSITGKGVVNRGDSLKSRRSRSNTSVASSNSSTEHIPSAATGSSLASSRDSSGSNGPCVSTVPAPYRVLMLGGPAVGKSSLVSQFMTSEYLHAYDTSLDDESGEKSVSVLLAGEESELTFIDHPYAELTPQGCVSRYPGCDLHAYCVVFSSSDRSSLAVAESVLQILWTSDTVSTKAVILVANKADLVRSRVITTEEGKSVATSYDCKYIETSVGINHNVDELLVGVLTQIRLKLENPERTRDIFRRRGGSRRNGSVIGSTMAHALDAPAAPTETTGVEGAATTAVSSSPHSTPSKKCRGSRTSASLKVRGLLGKVWARDSKSKSCENLHVL